MSLTETASATDQIARLEQRWLDCYLSADVPAFAALLDENFVYTSERGVFRKAEYVANLAAGVIEMRGLENIERETIFHGDTAVSIGVVRMDASFQGQDISGQDRFTRVWQRQGDEYKVIALHANTLATPGS